MRAVEFRVQNYKNIEDTNWVTCGDLICLVGKNESGKSSILRGLSKLNPSDGEPYNGLKEFPRRRYSAEFDNSDWPVSSAVFELSDSEVTELKQLSIKFGDTKRVTCTRHYSGALDVDFSGLTLPDVSWKRFVAYLKKCMATTQELTSPAKKVNEFTPIKNNIVNHFSKILQGNAKESNNEDNMDFTIFNATYNFIFSQITADWHRKIFRALIEDSKQLKTDIDLFEGYTQAIGTIEKWLPRFVYFDDLNTIESAINITDFNGRIKSNPTDPRLRATKCLFEHVGLSLDDIQALDPTLAGNKSPEALRRMADTREVMMSAASSHMTSMFTGWWEQRKHKFRYQVDGPSFRVWVSDNLDPSEIELDQRSKGMQYFFSFYLVFLVEAKGMYNNAIILLDEPALHLHGTAQQQILKFLGNLSKQNQLIYTTHSPFMIDGDNLTNVRVVSENRDGTVQVSENIWPKDEDALFPLQAGLGYSIAQTLFCSKRQIIVEGITDYWILKAINSILAQKKLTAIKDDIAIVPCGGAKKLFPLASMLTGNKISIAILLDGDEVGKQWGKEAKAQLLTKCIFINQFNGSEEAEIEDLLPPKLYLGSVEQAYPDIKGNLTFTQDEERINCISKKVKAAFKRMGKEFEKAGPTKILIDQLKDDPALLPPENLEIFSKLSENINELLP